MSWMHRFLPEIVGAVLVCHDDYGNLGVALNRIHSIRGVGVVFFDVGPEGLQC